MGEQLLGTVQPCIELGGSLKAPAGWRSRAHGEASREAQMLRLRSEEGAPTKGGLCGLRGRLARRRNQRWPHMSSGISSSLRWSLSVAQKAREVAFGAKPMMLRARVAGHTTKMVRDAGGACVRLELLDAPLQSGGWLGICSDPNFGLI